jgi:hypothetical protein
MPANPNEERLKRWGRVAAGAVGAIACFGVDVVVLVTGRTSGVSGFSRVYTPNGSPSQFWFTVVLFALMGLAAAWYAWSAYRE